MAGRAACVRGRAAAQHGVTALGVAALNAHVYIMRLLIERGADVNMRHRDTVREGLAWCRPPSCPCVCCAGRWGARLLPDFHGVVDACVALPAHVLLQSRRLVADSVALAAVRVHSAGACLPLR